MNTTQSDIVKLNVGGQSFHTSRSKLMISAYFRNLLEGDMKGTSTIDDEEIFIDRCGMLFEYLLQYLRTGYIGGGNNVRLQDLQQEALYYQLDTLVEALDTRQEEPKKYEYSFMDLSQLLPRPMTGDQEVKGSFDVLQVVEVKQAHTICWQHGGIYGVPIECSHGRGCKRTMNQLTAKLLVKKGI
ncbi:hypothetical protein INT47_010910 [Mucor saturninus]|uniref:BTB domain-containing protein n=1 Tax=Mucor saturninus TaxID=64648 RepID=A0A8H7RB66_9FUNG|nr:hypothetical protein INT47_010910 [Mucor saturninus]